MGTERSMDQVFINKLTDILEANLENEQFGVKDFSQEMGLSQSQLRRKLNALTNKSASQFIREYRLEKAMEMLQNNVATASEISYRVGFASPTYFNTCFREFYGYPPGEVKFRETIIDEPIKIIKISGQNEPSPSIQTRKKPVMHSRILASSMVLLLLFTISYFFFTGSIEKENNFMETMTNDKSIAILPFESLSDEGEIQHFTDGVTSMILNHLSYIKELKVISGITMKQYRTRSNTTLEIAKELDISYILTGNVQKYGDTVRIIVQLIDAKNDRNLWSKTYDGNYSQKMLEFQVDIAEKIAKSMNAIISPEEQENLDETIKLDIKAYDKVIKASYERGIYWKTLDDKHLERAHLLLDQALEIEPEYVRALRAKVGIYAIERKFDMAIIYLNKVKKIDPNNKHIDATLGDYYFLQGDQRNAIKHFTKAIELTKDGELLWNYIALGRSYGMINEPIKGIKYSNMALKSNSHLLPIAHFHIAKIYLRISYYKKADYHFRKAMESKNEGCWAEVGLMFSLSSQGKFQESIAYAQQICDNHDDCIIDCESLLSIAYFQNKQFDKALEYYLNIKEPLNYLKNQAVLIYYKQGKILESNKILKEQLVYYTNHDNEDRLKFGKNNRLAELYAFQGDKEKALFHLQQYIDENHIYIYGNELDYLPFNPFYEKLWGDKDFKAFIKSVQDRNRAYRLQVDEMEKNGEIE